jgi:hypothetical protein
MAACSKPGGWNTTALAGARGRGGLEPLDRVAALDPGRGKPPDAVGYPVLVKSESSGIAEMFVNLPHQWVTGRRHTERNAASFSPRQHDVAVKMLGDNGNVFGVTAHELSAQINISH